MSLPSSLVTGSFIVLVLNGCGGSSSPTPHQSVMQNRGGPQSPSVTNQGTGNSAASGTVVFSIVVPNSTNGVRSTIKRRNYISIATRSIRIQQIAPSSPSPPTVNATLRYGASGCSSDTTLALRCSITATVNAGSDLVFVVSTYASSDESGPTLASGSVALSVASGATETQVLSLDGVVSKFAIKPDVIHAAADGTVQTFPVTVEALDAAGAVIVGNQPFASPISLTIAGDVNRGLTLSTTTVSSPNTPVALRWDSTRVVRDGVIRAVALSSPQNSTSTHFTPLIVTSKQGSIVNLIAGQPTDNFGVSEANFSGTFTPATQPNTGGLVITSKQTGPGTYQLLVDAPQGGDAGGTGAPPGTYLFGVSDGYVRSYGTPIQLSYPKINATLSPASSTSPFFADIDSLRTGSDGRVWFLSSSGSSRTIVAVSDQGFVSTYQLNALNATHAAVVGRMIAAPNGSLWFGTSDDRICRFDETTLVLACFDMSATATTVDVVAADANGVYYIGTDAILGTAQGVPTADHIPGVGIIDMVSGQTRGFHDLVFPASDPVSELSFSCAYESTPLVCDYSKSSAAIARNGELYYGDKSGPFDSFPIDGGNLVAIDPKTGTANSVTFPQLGALFSPYFTPYGVGGPDAKGRIVVDVGIGVLYIDPSSTNPILLQRGLTSSTTFISDGTFIPITTPTVTSDGSVWMGAMTQLADYTSFTGFSGKPSFYPMRVNPSTMTIDKFDALSSITSLSDNTSPIDTPPFGFAETAHAMWIANRVGDSAYILDRVPRK